MIGTVEMTSKTVTVSEVVAVIESAGAYGAVGRLRGNTAVMSDINHKEKCFTSLRAAGFNLKPLAGDGGEQGQIFCVIVTKAR